MSENDDPQAGKKSATQALAELVARRKAGAGAQAPEKTRRGAERAAAARSASKSKPALRK